MTPALRLVDVMCVLFPERRIKIQEVVASFYSTQEQKVGESLVHQGVITEEELKLALLQQKAELGKFDKTDNDELWRIQRAVHSRFMAAFEDVCLIARGPHGGCRHG
jgi:hypothetical protein